MDWKQNHSIEDHLRAERPKAPPRLERAITSELRPARRHRTRIAVVYAAGLLGLLTVGGLGYATTYAGHVIAVITGSKTLFSTHRIVSPLNAARDQYGTTTGATTTTVTTTTSSTTTTANGTASTGASNGSSGSITTSSPSTGQSVGVTWQASTFSAPVVVQVTPSPTLSGVTLVGTGNALVSITVTDKTTGAPVTSFATPLEVIFPNPPAGFVPSISTDGVNFRALSLLVGQTLPTGQQDGYFVASDGIHILTRHLTIFGVIAKANLTVSESGRKFQPAGSGKFGDPELIHVGPAVLRIVKAPALSGRTVSFTFSVDEQVAFYLHVLSQNREVTLGKLVFRGSTVSTAPAKTKHVAITRPGTITATATIVGGSTTRPLTLQLTAVDYDGVKTAKNTSFR